MRFTDIEFFAVRNDIEHFLEYILPSTAFLSKHDVIFRIYDQCIEISHERTTSAGDDNKKTAIAKIIFNRADNKWYLYCQQTSIADELCEKNRTLDEALEIVSTNLYEYAAKNQAASL